MLLRRFGGVYEARSAGSAGFTGRGAQRGAGRGARTLTTKPRRRAMHGAGVSGDVLRSGKRLLAAVALQKIHRVDGNCVAADGVVVVHSILLL